MALDGRVRAAEGPAGRTVQEPILCPAFDPSVQLRWI
jgi:hypothetical protein